MAEGKAPTRRKTITLAVETIRYLEELATKGTHGSDIAGVARTLIEQGVRDAIRDHFIKLR
jgi:hypothetical protein